MKLIYTCIHTYTYVSRCTCVCVFPCISVKSSGINWNWKVIAVDIVVFFFLLLHTFAVQYLIEVSVLFVYLFVQVALKVFVGFIVCGGKLSFSSFVKSLGNNKSQCEIDQMSMSIVVMSVTLMRNTYTLILHNTQIEIRPSQMLRSANSYIVPPA